MKKQRSEFGRGLAYCLGNFLAHEGRLMVFDCNRVNVKKDYGLWFYGSTDHLFDLEVPKEYPLKLKKKILAFRDRCLYLRLPMDGYKATEKDFRRATGEAREILMEIDKRIGVKSVKGDYE
jgi:hypothetical protein